MRTYNHCKTNSNNTYTYIWKSWAYTCKLYHNKAIFKKVQHIHSEYLIGVQSDSRSRARCCRGSLMWVTKELRSQRTAGLSLNPRARGTKWRKQCYVVLVLGPPGMIWNHGCTSRLKLEPCRKGCIAEAGNVGKMLPVSIRSREEWGENLAAPLLSFSITGSLHLGL